MRRMDRIGRDQGILTREEMKYVEEAIVEQIHEHLIGRDLFPLVRVPDAGYMDYKYYEELDMGPASISRYGTSQSDDRTLYYYNEVPIPIIDKTFFIQRRDILASRHQGPSLLEQYPRNAARQIAEEEDKLLLTGEYTGWAAMGINGLLTGAGTSAAASGAWPANAIADINTARIALENLGFIGTEGVLIGRPATMKCLDRQLTNTETTYRKFLENNGLVRATYETRNLFAADGGADSVLLVIPGKENFYMVEAEPPTVDWWYDKMSNAYGWVHEAVVPVIARAEAIYEISSVTCS
jgi:uncharacterized linocin/CFP29 family protein